MKKEFQLIQVFDDPSQGFRGNISSVVLLDQLPETKIMQRLASDLAQPATTFLAPLDSNAEYKVRWFAPDGEIGLCGHGSLAAMAFLNKEAPGMEYTLHYRNGKLSGKAERVNKAQINLNPIPVQGKLPVDEALKEGLGIPILEYWHTNNKDIVLVNSEKSLRNMKPDFNRLRDRNTFGYAVTAKGDKVDFVSRTLVPHVGQLEDHATGSSHAILVPFWAERLGETRFEAEQLSPRKGKFSCAFDPDSQKVKLTGRYSIIAKGEILI
jgi:PhzF family phenazine biosynthesis protein